VHTYRLLGDTVRAREFGDSARVVFEAQLRDFPERAQIVDPADIAAVAVSCVV